MKLSFDIWRDTSVEVVNGERGVVVAVPVVKEREDVGVASCNY